MNRCCPIESAGLRPKRVKFIPEKDVHGVFTGRAFRVVEGGFVHRKLVEAGHDVFRENVDFHIIKKNEDIT